MSLRPRLEMGGTTPRQALQPDLPVQGLHPVPRTREPSSIVPARRSQGISLTEEFAKTRRHLCACGMIHGSFGESFSRRSFLYLNCLGHLYQDALVARRDSTPEFKFHQRRPATSSSPFEMRNELARIEFPRRPRHPDDASSGQVKRPGYPVKWA